MLSIDIPIVVGRYVNLDPRLPEDTDVLFRIQYDIIFHLTRHSKKYHDVQMSLAKA